MTFFHGCEQGRGSVGEGEREQPAIIVQQIPVLLHHDRCLAASSWWHGQPERYWWWIFAPIAVRKTGKPVRKRKERTAEGYRLSGSGRWLSTPGCFHSMRPTRSALSPPRVKSVPATRPGLYPYWRPSPLTLSLQLFSSCWEKGGKPYREDLLWLESVLLCWRCRPAAMASLHS